MRARYKWLLLAVDIVEWELTCGQGELLSDECHRVVDSHPAAARLVIIVVGSILTAHLSRTVPKRFDLMSRSFWRPVFGHYRSLGRYIPFKGSSDGNLAADSGARGSLRSI